MTFLLVVNALLGERGLIKTLRVKREFAEQLRALEAVRAENQRLLETVRQLSDDPRAIEEAARRDLSLMRPGELLVIVKDVEPEGREQGQRPDSEKKTGPVRAPGPTPDPTPGPEGR